MTETIREVVREKYAKAITAKKKSCCGGSGAVSSCCDGGLSKATKMITGNLYSAEDTVGLPEDMVTTSFGCGNPTALAELYAGEVVLDLGSGAGLDVLLSAKRVGPYGKAYGLDMTDEMLDEARRNQASAQITNVEFLKGHIEEIPLPENTVDVIISNCVINLSADKERVLREAFRVLKPGGRFAVSDIVLTKELPAKVQEDLMAWAGCISGAMLESEYRNKLAGAGFVDVEVQVTRVYDFSDSTSEPFSRLSLEELKQLEGAVVSAFIRARKPKKVSVEGADFRVRRAVDADLLQINQLLNNAGLPVEGIEANVKGFFVAEGNEILGVIGMELSSEHALLRSLTVDVESRKRGIADSLIKNAVKEAKAKDIKELYLLTGTAEKYLKRFGFAKIAREEIPEALLKDSALNCACSPCSTCMKLAL